MDRCISAPLLRTFFQFATDMFSLMTQKLWYPLSIKLVLWDIVPKLVSIRAPIFSENCMCCHTFCTVYRFFLALFDCWCHIEICPTTPTTPRKRCAELWSKGPVRYAPKLWSLSGVFDLVCRMPDASQCVMQGYALLSFVVCQTADLSSCITSLILN